MSIDAGISQTYTTPENLKASFWGLVTGEWFKMSRKWSTWIWLAFVALAVGGATFLLAFASSGSKQQFDQNPEAFFATFVFFGLDVTRIMGGIAAIFIASSMIGMEYQGGTLRILLARGVGRLQFYCAKIMAMLVFSLAILLIGIVVLNVMVIAFVLAHQGSFSFYTKLPSEYWQGFAIYGGMQVLNMFITILLAFAFIITFRSYAVGMTLAILWFPVDNLGSNILFILTKLTKNDFWQNITGYLLGPNLNLGLIMHMPKAARLVAGQLQISSGPAVEVGWQQNFLVLAAYGLLFLVVAVTLFIRRDVKE